MSGPLGRRQSIEWMGFCGGALVGICRLVKRSLCLVDFKAMAFVVLSGFTLSHFSAFASTSLDKKLSLNNQGVWQRVYDECGTWKPSSQSEMFDRAREYTPYREVTLIFEEDQTYSAIIGFSRACHDTQLKTHANEIDCRSGINRGAYAFSNAKRELQLNAIFQTEVNSLWGAQPLWLEFQFIDGILMLTQKKSSLCLGGPWSIYFLNFTTS